MDDVGVIKHRKLFIRSWGCQMNVRDGEEVTGLLLERGYSLTDVEAQADVILFNTCSVREHAEDKVWSNVGALKSLKAQHPELIIGVMGCMAKAQRGLIFKRMPHVDFISGPAQLYQVPELIDAIYQERRPMTPPPVLPGNLSDSTRMPGRPCGPGAPPLGGAPKAGGGVMAIKEKTRPEFQHVSYHAGEVSALVTIMEGCDKVCSYCIIPYTRGPEVSRPPEQIVQEVGALVEKGYKEVMLLGQNVNSYGHRLKPQTTFAQLLAQVNAIPGIERIRFITSHPWDAVEELFAGMRDLEHVCEHLHLPVQSGSDAILKKMRRGYTAQEYLGKLELLRKMVPEVAVTTDIIVGFPGETDQDFHGTLELMKQAQFDSAFVFSYSPRPFAAASRWEDDVPKEVKDERLQQVLKLQEEISFQKDQTFVGKEVEVLVEKSGMGRSRSNHKVYFEGATHSPGDLVDVHVESIRGHSLIGKTLLGFCFLLWLAGITWGAEDIASLQGAFLRGEYSSVVEKSRQQLESSHPEHPDELLYLQGVSALKLDDLGLARSSLQKLLQLYPDSHRAPHAKELLQADDFYFSVQVGAFGSKANALRLKTELERRGYPVAVMEMESRGRRLYRVRVGRFTSREEAEIQAERLRAEGFPGKVVP